MKIVKVNVSTGNGSTPGGHVGVPQKRHWLDDWIEDQSRWVLLKCGCIEDITLRGTLLINSFNGSTVYCERCCDFAEIIRVVKTRKATVVQPELPPF